MNFYTFFKNRSKTLYKEISKTYPSDYLLSRGISNLATYRNKVLRLAFGFDSLDVSHFQIACFRVVPIDLPKEFYLDFWYYLFCPSICHSSFNELIVFADYKSKLYVQLSSLLEDN